MKFPNLIFLVFGGIELASGLMGLTFSLADYEALFNITPLADPAVMIFMKGFSNALLSLGLMTIMVFFLPESRARAGFAAALVVMNAIAGWYCFSIENLPAVYASGAWMHGVFAIVFSWIVFYYSRLLRSL